MRTGKRLGAMVIGVLGLAGASACGGVTGGSAAPTARSEAAAPKPSSAHVRIPNGDRQVVVSVVDTRGGARHPLLRFDDAGRIDARGTGIGEQTRLSFQP